MKESIQKWFHKICQRPKYGEAFYVGVAMVAILSAAYGLATAAFFNAPVFLLFCLPQVFIFIFLTSYEI